MEKRSIQDTTPILVILKDGTMSVPWGIIQKCKVWRVSVDGEYIEGSEKATHQQERPKHELNLRDACRAHFELVIQYLRDSALELPRVWQIARHSVRYIIHGNMNNLNMVIGVAKLAHKYVLEELLNVCDLHLDLRRKEGGGVPELREGTVDWAAPLYRKKYAEDVECLDRVVQIGVQLELPHTLGFFSTLTPKYGALDRLVQYAAEQGDRRMVEWLLRCVPFPSSFGRGAKRRVKEQAEHHAALKKIALHCAMNVKDRCTVEVMQFVADTAKESEVFEVVEYEPSRWDGAVEKQSVKKVYCTAGYCIKSLERLLVSKSTDDVLFEKLCTAIARWQKLWKIAGAHLMGVILDSIPVQRLQIALRGIHAGLYDRQVKQDSELLSNLPVNPEWWGDFSHRVSQYPTSSGGSDTQSTLMPSPIERWMLRHEGMVFAQAVAACSPMILGPPVAIWFCQRRRYGCALSMLPREDRPGVDPSLGMEKYVCSYDWSSHELHTKWSVVGYPLLLGMTMLSETARHGDLPAVRVLLERNESQALARASGVLVAAVESGRIEVVDAILHAMGGGHPGDGRAALTLACANDDVVCVGRLLGAGIRPCENAQQAAATVGSVRITRMLLDAGGKADWGLLAAVEAACEQQIAGARQVALLLLRAGGKAKSTAALLLAIHSRDTALALQLIPVTAMGNGQSVIHVAAAWGNEGVDVVRALVESSRVAVHTLDERGRTALECTPRDARKVQDLLIEADLRRVLE